MIIVHWFPHATCGWLPGMSTVPMLPDGRIVIGVNCIVCWRYRTNESTPAESVGQVAQNCSLDSLPGWGNWVCPSGSVDEIRAALSVYFIGFSVWFDILKLVLVLMIKPQFLLGIVAGPEQDELQSYGWRTGARG